MKTLIICLFLILFISCDKEKKVSCPDNDLAVQETLLRAKIDTLRPGFDFTIKLGASDGREFLYERGSSLQTTSYKSASTAKLVTATVIMSLVERGILSLEDHPQKYIEFWPTDSYIKLSQIKLKHLLNFTSGLEKDNLCTASAISDFENCVFYVMDANIESTKTPGSSFYYSRTHMQVAGLMAMRALNVNRWEDVFNDFKRRTGFFPSAQYNQPSMLNPNLAGGMHWNTKEYFDFMKGLYNQQNISFDLVKLILDTIPNLMNGVKEIAYSPVKEYMNEDWRYGLGFWLECHNSQYNCGLSQEISSPGLFGSYPFMNLDKGFYGIVALYSTKPDAMKYGYNLYRSIKTEIEAWNDGTCSQN